MSWVDYSLTLIVVYAIYLIVAMGLNLIVGYCGRLTLAHGALYGAGGYAYALVALKMGPLVGAYAALFTAGVVGAILSLPLSLSERRLRGDFFVIGSLAIQAILYGIFMNWHTPAAPVGTWQNLTNGTAGLAGIPRPTFFASPASFAMFTLILATLVALVVSTLIRSPWGRLIRASRDDRLVTEGLGKPVLRARVQAFAVAGATAALGGALYVAYASYISPDLGSVDVSVFYLSMGLIGGVGTLRGPVVGAAVLLAIEEGIRMLKISIYIKHELLGAPYASFTDANIQLLTYGALLLILLRFKPEGLAGDRDAVQGFS